MRGVLKHSGIPWMLEGCVVSGLLKVSGALRILLESEVQAISLAKCHLGAGPPAFRYLTSCVEAVGCLD